jgi:hypothetical protein
MFRKLRSALAVLCLLTPIAARAADGASHLADGRIVIEFNGVRTAFPDAELARSSVHLDFPNTGPAILSPDGSVDGRAELMARIKRAEYWPAERIESDIDGFNRSLVRSDYISIMHTRSTYSRFAVQFWTQPKGKLELPLYIHIFVSNAKHTRFLDGGGDGNISRGAKQDVLNALFARKRALKGDLPSKRKYVGREDFYGFYAVSDDAWAKPEIAEIRYFMPAEKRLFSAKEELIVSCDILQDCRRDSFALNNLLALQIRFPQEWLPSSFLGADRHIHELAKTIFIDGLPQGIE